MFDPNQNQNVQNETEMAQTILNPFEQVKAASIVSPKYHFISTSDLKNVFESANMHFQEVNKVKARKLSKIGYQKHSFAVYGGDLKLSKAEMLSQRDVPRIIGTNSHCGDSSLILRAGFFRRVCENGLLVSDDIVAPIRLRHRNLTADKILEAVAMICQKYNLVEEYFSNLKDITPTSDERIEYAKLMANYRLQMGTEREIVNVHNYQDLLTVRRKEDAENNWWNLINVVQENIVGKPISLTYSFKSLDKNNVEVIKTRNTSVSPIRQIDANMKINQACFSVANELMQTNSSLMLNAA